MVEDTLDTISVVIPTYITNPSQLSMSIRCIDLCRKFTKLDFQLIIVETGTNYLSDYSDIYIYEKKRTTADKSINRAFFCCDTKYSVLLTNDVEVDEGWLESLISPFHLFNDCGISTLASDQFSHIKQDKIEEGIWGSVFMINSKYARFDENYINSWEDSDLWMSMYSKGYKMYRNFNCVVHHKPGQTVYKDKLTQDNYDKNREYFINKWKNSNIKMYDILTKGYIV